jgi:hypothetical protein
MYQSHFNRYLKDDPFLELKIDEIKRADALSLMTRMKNLKTKDGRDLAETRTFGIVIRFVRMAFKEYEEENLDWQNPFSRIKAPKRKERGNTRHAGRGMR